MRDTPTEIFKSWKHGNKHKIDKNFAVKCDPSSSKPLDERASEASKNFREISETENKISTEKNDLKSKIWDAQNEIKPLPNGEIEKISKQKKYGMFSVHIPRGESASRAFLETATYRLTD